MPVSLSIKNVPDDLAQRLRERAKRNHRSLQGGCWRSWTRGSPQKRRFHLPIPRRRLYRLPAGGRAWWTVMRCLNSGNHERPVLQWRESITRM